ncbi:DNA-binding transcriptional LysR family regulator [Kineococcus radiotolerans]|uniref:DNA-binding transcriptional LysR family regulator n=1 Tax=Kineococcus radiotolerans TaxID=131568 RepID=A0A7W4TSC3_KINRA|nr:LysR family transcriptional regulator [Kineococcus radiotolerans]MBB2903596.1 DNA-binding transcriptional LysR family regulator [Kineococcus radiotolerans]
MPTLRALECFVAVLDHGSLTEAARHLHTSQPALSHQLASLERELRTPLLHRLPRGVAATSAGRAVERDARAALTAAAAVTRVGRAVAAGISGRLRLACVESLTAPLLAPVLGQWRLEHPEVEVELAEFSSANALAEQLQTAGADLGLTPRPTSWAGQTLVVGREEVVLVLPPGSPLAVPGAGPGAGPTLSEVAAHPIVGFSIGNGLAAWLDALAVDAGLRWDIVVRTRSAVTAAQLACAGLGIALVPVSALGEGFAGTVSSVQPVLERELVVLLPTGADELAGDLGRALVEQGAPAYSTTFPTPAGAG